MTTQKNRNQLNIFDSAPESNQIIEPVKSNAFDYDGMMSFLNKMNEDMERQNQELQAMLDKIQEGWTDDEKLQVSNPKEYYKQQKLKDETINQESIMAKELTVEAVDTLKNSKVNGMVVMLPEGQLDRNVYVEVKNKLELIGGKWKGGKIGGFVFQEDPTDLLEQISNGENRNLKKEFQFFGTPDALADQLVDMSGVGVLSSVLEPSAGQGAIVKAILRKNLDLIVYGYELMPLNQTILKKLPNFVLEGSDFLTECFDHYTHIIANPPFSKNQDIDHIRKMYSCLREGGRLVSIASTHWQHASGKKETEFRSWLKEVDSEVILVPSGAFKESGTTVPTVIIIIDKE